MKTPEQLLDLYYRSVGHNGTLLLNFPVDRDGLIHPTDSANAVRFHQLVQAELKTDLLAGLLPEVSNERGGKFTASALTDGDSDTYWATADSVDTAEVTFSFYATGRMNRMLLQEYIPLGQRVKSFVVESRDGDGTWRPVRLNEETTTIGYKRLLRFETVTADAIRVRFTESRGSLCISTISLYDAGEGADLTYTVPTEQLKSLPFSLPLLPEQEAAFASDRNGQTTLFVHADSLLIDLGAERTVSSFHFLPDQGETSRGLVSNYELSVGPDASRMDRVVKSGEFSNIRNNPVMQSVYFTPVTTRYLLLKATRMVVPGEPMGFAEIAVQ